MNILKSKKKGNTKDKVDFETEYENVVKYEKQKKEQLKLQQQELKRMQKETKLIEQQQEILKMQEEEKKKVAEDLKSKIYKLIRNYNIEIEKEKLIKQKIEEISEAINLYKQELNNFGITYEDPK